MNLKQKLMTCIRHNFSDQLILFEILIICMYNTLYTVCMDVKRQFIIHDMTADYWTQNILFSGS